jgi:hypothetical protein
MVYYHVPRLFRLGEHESRRFLTRQPRLDTFLDLVLEVSAKFFVKFRFHRLRPEQSMQTIEKVADHGHLRSLSISPVSFNGKSPPPTFYLYGTALPPAFRPRGDASRLPQVFSNTQSPDPSIAQWFHSYRSATMGSTRVARTAGNIVPAAAVRATNIIAAMSDFGSCGEMPYSSE